MKNITIAAICFFAIIGAPSVEAQDLQEVFPDHQPAEAFYRGTVLDVLEHREDDVNGEKFLTQLLRVRIDSGEEEGQEIEIENSGVFSINGGEGVTKGERVVVYKASAEGLDTYYIADTYRLPAVMYIILFFFLVAVWFARWKGFASIIGLGVSVLIISKFVVPQIIEGGNPILISLLGALGIAFASIYLSHGFNRRTSIALVSTLITLGIAAIMSYTFVKFGRLFGMGSEEAFYLQFGPLQGLNLQGLLLGGIILGALGVLDDITTAQSATIDELKKANQSLTMSELYSRGLSVGKEHIASLVNTLFLAYAGASLPLFLFFTANSVQPLWVTFNAEFMAEEIVRTLVGSIALILAVPITTFLASYYFSKNPSSPGEPSGHHHAH